jgi:hypothetical protein
MNHASSTQLMQILVLPKKQAKNEKEENSKHVSHCMAVQCGDTVLQYESKGLQQNDSTAATKSKTVTRSQNNYSQK